jgi:hypothetical protein
MNRRSVLFAMGATSLSAGAIFGSGAFTTIEADRSVELNVKSDANARIAFSKIENSNGNLIVGTDKSNAVDIIKFSRTDLNEQAKTTFKNAFKIKNNGTAPDVYVHVQQSEDDDAGGDVDAAIGSDGLLDFRVEHENDNSTTRSIVGNTAKDGYRLNGGDEDSREEVNVHVEVDLLSEDVNDDDDSSDDNDLTAINEVTFVVTAINPETSS